MKKRVNRETENEQDEQDGKAQEPHTLGSCGDLSMSSGRCQPGIMLISKRMREEVK